MTAAVTSSFANAPNLDKGVITSNNFKKTGMHNTKLLLNNKQTTPVLCNGTPKINFLNLGPDQRDQQLLFDRHF